MNAERLTAQRLAGPPLHAVPEVAGHLLAVQAQDPRGMRLTVRSRSTGLTAADVDRAITDERSVVVDWLNRGTIHLVRREDHDWLHALTTPPLRAAAARRLQVRAITPEAAERGIAAIARALADGPLERDRLREPLASAIGVVADEAVTALLFAASLRGLVVRGPVTGPRTPAFVLRRDWLGAPRAVDRDAALAELARRWLASHWPGSERDLASWANLPLRDVRTGLRAIAGELETGAGGLLRPRRRPPAAELPPPRLLGPFDPVLHGWPDRRWIAGDAAPGVITSNGIFRAIALVRGRAVATWTMPGARVTLAPLTRIAKADRAALEADGRALRAWLGLDGA